MNETLHQLTDESNKQLEYIKRKIADIISENKSDLNEISNSYISFNLKNKKNKFIIDFLKNKWNGKCKKNNNCQLFYHENNGEIHTVSKKDDPFSQITLEHPKFSLNRTNGEHLFLCNYDDCNLYITKPLSLYDFKSGLMVISIHIDYIIDQISRELYETDLIFINKAHPEKKINKLLNNINNYQYLGSTNHTKYENFKEIFKKEKINTESKKELTLVNYKNENYAFGYTEYDNLTIISIKNIDTALENSANALSEFIKNSIILLPFIIFVFYFLLSHSMRKIDKLSDILKIIGSKNFKKANEILKENRRKKIHDEIDNIYNSVHILSNDLESTLDELGETNKKLTKKIEEIRFLADHDALTGLYNRRRFSIELKSYFERKNPFLLVSADLNHFKLVNDSLGHSVGDDLLVSFSKVLLSTISDKGIIGRMGGDEFAIIIFGENNSFAKKILNDISIKTKTILKKNNHGIKVSTSLGVARYPLDSDNMEGLSSYSDVAMYENKRFQTDPYNYYNGSETIVKEEREAQVWQSLINKNLQESNLVPYQQTIVSSKDHSIHACEILVRIQDRSKILPTADFIYYAEKNRTVIQIDKYIIKQALKYFSSFNYPRLTINLSYLTIATNDIIEYILECKESYDYPAERIVFEITETVEVSNILLVQKFIKKLKKHGFYFALDDFGSGFSSFGYLANLGVDYIKIDKSLINNLSNSETTQHIVKSIISLAKNLKIAIIAEGIEDKASLKEVNKYDIDYFQGYYFSKPKPLNKHPCVHKSINKKFVS